MSERNIKEDYLQGAENLRPFYQYSLHEGPNFGEILNARRSVHLDRETLAQALEKQFPEGVSAPKSLENIRALRSDSTFTVTTGHQLNLMTGPLYLPYKILTAIRLAEELNQQFPEQNIVPVYWMATEDHDFEEINHYFANYGEKRSYPGTFRGAVGRHVIEESMQGLIPEQFKEEWATFFKAGKIYAEGFKELIYHLFGKYGIVVVDGDDPALKGLFQEDMLWELEKQGASQALKKTSAELLDAGYNAQVHIRDINLFYLEESRHRITLQGNEYQAGNKSLSQEKIRETVQANPERISPNVAMRPLYQERILPNLAYIGGWGELSYWMQLKGMFDARELPFPLLFPRMSATLITSDQARAWKDLGLEIQDFRRMLYQVNNSKVGQIWDDGPYLEKLAKVEEAFADLSESIEDLSPPLAMSVRAQSARSRNRMGKVLKKLKKELRARNGETFEQVAQLKNAVQPDHKVQERILNISHFSANNADDLIDHLYSHCHPLNFEHQCLILP